MTNEFWRIVEDHPNYMISDQGRLMNIKRGRIIKGSIHRDGYHRYCLSTNGKTRSWFAHQLVARAFIPNLDNLPIDEIKTHNYPSNLEWSTRLDGERVTFHNMSKFCMD
jgi:hypothetical protein